MKKVLIISYYWPPAGGISVHRSLKVAKYLRQFGWEPVVYTALDAQYPYFDKDNDKDIPEDITVIKQPIIEPFDIFKKFSGRTKNDPLNSIVQVRDKKFSIVDKLGLWVRGNFFIPDARSLWIKPSVKFLKKYLSENPVDAIFTDGPPHTNTAIACELKKSLNVPWLADFQDPWTQVDYYSMFPLTKWADKKHKRMEQEVFKHADQITIVSPSWKKDLENIGASKVEVVYWGFDPEDFPNEPTTKSNDELVITHTGLMGFDRSPDMLLEAVSELMAENPVKKINLKFAGQVDYSVIEQINRLKIQDYVTLPGTISRKEALDLMLSSDILLLLLNKAKNVKGRMPGKFYEYIGSQKSILCLGPTDSDISSVINELDIGNTFDYQNKDGIKDYIISEMRREKSENFSNQDVDKYSVVTQVGKIASILDRIV